jgi:putative transposase
MPFWKCYYHAVWTTFHREPAITPQIEPVIIDTVKRKSSMLNCPILAISTVTDHIHIAVSITPGIAAAEWVRNVKGLSTREVNSLFPDLPSHFRWQKSYGLLTCGEKNLPFVVSYIERQKEHHANNTLEPYLERIDTDD